MIANLPIELIAELTEEYKIIEENGQIIFFFKDKPLYVNNISSIDNISLIPNYFSYRAKIRVILDEITSFNIDELNSEMTFHLMSLTTKFFNLFETVFINMIDMEKSLDSFKGLTNHILKDASDPFKCINETTRIFLAIMNIFDLAVKIGIREILKKQIETTTEMIENYNDEYDMVTDVLNITTGQIKEEVMTKEDLITLLVGLKKSYDLVNNSSEFDQVTQYDLSTIQCVGNA
jgi:hypothetical protein